MAPIPTEPPAHLRVATPAGTFAYLAAGRADAPVVLCLHGFPDTPLGFRGLMLPLAGEGFRVIAPYMRGYHPSTTAGPYHADRLADDIITLADTFSGHRPVHLIGHDWGALATYVALSRSPGRFARAVTLAVPHPQAILANLRHHPTQLRRSWYMAFLSLGARAEALASAHDFELVQRLWSQWSPNYRPADDYLGELKRCLAASAPAPFLYYRALFRPLADALRRARRHLPIDTPTLHLHGARDGCLTPALREGQSRHFRARFEARVLPDLGHFLHIEDPETVTEHILPFLLQ